MELIVNCKNNLSLNLLSFVYEKFTQLNPSIGANLQMEPIINPGPVAHSCTTCHISSTNIDLSEMIMLIICKGAVQVYFVIYV